MRAAAWIVGVLLLATAPRVSSQQPLLQIVGEPYFGGAITVHLRAPGFVGQPAALAYGLDPLPTPISTGKGAWYIGQLFKILSLGVVPADGRIDLPLTMPPDTPAVEGLPVIVQAFVPPRLSNPAELRLDAPYLTTATAVEVFSPLPASGANFGDRVAAGDFDGDGHMDLAVGAAFEAYGGFGTAGSVYIMWGPDWTDGSDIRPPAPGPFTGFGFGLAAADFDGDDVDDLVITQLAPDPPGPTDFGHVYLVNGGASRDLAPVLVALSPSGGLDAAFFGRFAAAGDVTGDGIPDAVIGAAGTSHNGTSLDGAILILPGPDLDAPWVLHNPTPVGADFFGDALTLAYVNDDEHLDIVEGSERADLLDPLTREPVVNAGEAHVGFGPDFSQWVPLRHPAGPTFEKRFGQRVAAADLDGDGLAEIATASSEDEAFLIDVQSGEYRLLPKPPQLTPPLFSESAFGYSLEFLDANADGRADLVIGDPFDGHVSPCPITSAGISWVALAPHYSTFALMSDPTAACADLFGWTAVVIDLNGDGRDDIVTGVRRHDSFGVPDSGKVVIHFGPN